MEIGKTFCGRTDGRTHLSSNLLGHRRGDDLKKEERSKIEITGQKYNVRICYAGRP